MSASPPAPRARRSSLGLWVAGARPRTLGASIAPVLVGTAAAVEPTFSHALGCAIVGLGLQIGVNYANDYSDGVRRVDTPDRVGPVRLTAAGLATPAAVRNAALIAFAVAGFVGAWLALATNPWLLVLGAAAIGAAVLYSGGPKPYSARGMGEVSVFVFFGLVACTGTAYVQGTTVPSAAWWGAVAVGVLAVAILVANNLRDIDTDAAAGKRTLAVRVGAPGTRSLYRGCLAACFAALAVGVATGGVPAWGLLAFVTVPIAIRPFVRIGHASGRALVPVLVATSLLDLSFGVALAAGLWIGRA